MQVYQYDAPEALQTRSHPWAGSLANPAHRHLDLRAHPELIRTSLEDFLPFAAWAATETFYRLLAGLNAPDSLLETNDCAFNGVSENTSPQFARGLQCSGRVMLLFRELALNTRANRVERLTQAVARSLSVTDPTFEWGVVGATIMSVRYVTLPGPPARQLGQQLMLSFWAFGDDEDEVMGHLDRTLSGVTTALAAVSKSLRREMGPDSV